MNETKYFTIDLCPGEHVETPLISTFAFIGQEYWCPVCGYTTGMFGVTKNVASTPELEALLDAYMSRAKPYLRYISSQGSGMEENQNGKLTRFEAKKVDYEYSKIIKLK